MSKLTKNPCLSHWAEEVQEEGRQVTAVCRLRRSCMGGRLYRVCGWYSKAGWNGLEGRKCIQLPGTAREVHKLHLVLDKPQQ